MGNDPYDSYDSPKSGVMPNEKYEKTIGEVSKAIGQLNATIRSIDQKVSLYGTSLDSRNNHEKLNELVEKGNKLVAKVQKRFKILNNDLKGEAGAVAKARTATVKKLSADFKTQLDLFQKSCENVVSSETQAVNNIRKTSSSFVSSQKANNPVLTNYNEDQIYAQAQVTTYDEDDMIRREEDIIHINHQLREINAAYKEIDGLINDQHEVVVEIAGNVDDAQDNAHRALDHVRQADAKRSYCACSKRKMWCYGGLLLVLIVIILSVVLSLIYSWGRGEDGQLGLGDTSDQYRPAIVEALSDKVVVQIACGSGHTVVLGNKGDVYTWGRGDDGRLGHGDNGWKFVPRLVEALQNKQIKQVTCGSYHTAAVTVSGDLYTWGGGMYGKLGHGNEVGHSVPYKVETLSNLKVDQVACGSRHTVVLLQNSDVYTWGDKENGVSGNGDTDGHQYLPCAVEELKNKGIKQIAACGFHTAALSDKGELYTFGEGKFGRLGHNSEKNQSVARVVETLLGNPIRQVACGGFHTAAVTESGEIYTWGGGEHGQLGHGDKVNKTIPSLVEKLRTKIIVEITCGWSHTVALTSTGEVYTWGNGDHGKLGHNDQVKVTLPKQVEGLHGKRVVSVASYNEHTIALVDPLPAFQSGLHNSTYASDMQTLVDQPDFADVVFLVESRRIFGHRAILAARCAHFKAMFSSGMRESREMEIPVPSIRIPVFLALLEYLYNDTVSTTMTAEMAIELYAAADMYGLDRLKDLCESIVQKGLVVENAAYLLQAADELQALRLRDISMRFIVRHFDYVTKTEGFQLLSRELILETLQNR